MNRRTGNRPTGIAILLCGLIAAGGAIHAAETQAPDWAYAIPTAADREVNRAPEPDDLTPISLPGSAFMFTPAEIRGRSRANPEIQLPPADWHPGDHPPMPDIVRIGNLSSGVRACAFCHYPNGKAYPGTAGLQGLPQEYIAQQLRDFRDGVRDTAEPEKENVELMIDIAKGMTEEEIEDASAYYASMEWTPWIRVVETDMVPKVWNRNGVFYRLEGSDAGTEPIGNRIIETPENSERTLLRDPRSGFVAFVPMGAVANGEELVRNRGGKTMQCGLCHGEDLHGLSAVPGIAARSPSYLVRQLYDIQQGTRHGNMAALMGPVVANLTAEDMLNIAAYTASLPAKASAP
jgi:cytochrome c553